MRNAAHIIALMGILSALMGLSLPANAQATAALTDTVSPPTDWEHHFILGVLPGSSDEAFKLGTTMQYSLLYNLRPYLMLGASAGVNTYEMQAGKTFYPLMLETKGYWGDVFNWSPYYSAGLGYGFAFRNSWDEIAEAEGGICWRASLGLSRAVGDRLKFVMDAGFQYQRGSLVKEFSFSDNRFIEEFQLQRISLRAGLVF